MTVRKGKCLCGAVEIRALEAEDAVGACHCTMCRRWGGGPYMEVECGTEVEFSGEEHIALFDSSAWAERGFCKHCGSHLFYRFKKTGRHGVPVGLFDDDAGLTFQHQVFIDEKPGFYEFANATKNMTGPEIIAKYSHLLNE